MDKKNFIGLNKEFKTDVDVSEYESLYVGFEFEFNIMKEREVDMSNRTISVNAVTGEVTDIPAERIQPRIERHRVNTETMNRKISEHFGVRFAKTDGKGTKKEKLNLASGGAIDVPISTDLYNDNQLVSQVYRDGSVDYEVVTRPVNLKRMRDIKSEVYDWCKGEGADFFHEGKGGLHLTFLLDHHMERSKWNKTVVQNLMQYARCYYKELVQLMACNSFARKLEYRKLFSLENMNECSTSHYNCITCRKDEYGNIWAIEVRFPCGCNDWDTVMRIVKFWMAMIRHCATISKFGRIKFDQEIWDEQRRFYESHSDSARIELNPTLPRIPQLVRQIKDSLIFYGVDVKDGTLVNKVKTKEEELYEIIWEKVLFGESYSNISRDLKKKGYDQKKIYAACKEVGIK